jgi:hypothetical protein
VVESYTFYVRIRKQSKLIRHITNIPIQKYLNIYYFRLHHNNLLCR